MTKPIRTKPIPYCPECGAQMVLRKPRNGQTWDAFWGCSQYPDCRGTRRIMDDGRPEPDDDMDDYRLD
jgi:ssDNA-binding Zn-finger/Zn-ribbon topoisomerase 1